MQLAKSKCTPPMNGRIDVSAASNPLRQMRCAKQKTDAIQQEREPITVWHDVMFEIAWAVGHVTGNLHGTKWRGVRRDRENGVAGVKKIERSARQGAPRFTIFSRRPVIVKYRFADLFW